MGQRIEPSADHQPTRTDIRGTLANTRRSISLPPPTCEGRTRFSQPKSHIHLISPIPVHSPLPVESSPSSLSDISGPLGPIIMPGFSGEITEDAIPKTHERVSIISRSNLTLASFIMDPNQPAYALPQLTTHLTARVVTGSGTLVVGDTHGSIYLVISAYIQAGVLQFKNPGSQISLCRLMAVTTFSLDPTEIHGRCLAITRLDTILSDLEPGPCLDRFAQVLLLGDNFYDRDGYDELTMLTLVVLNRFIPTYFLIGNHDRDFLVNCLNILAEEYNHIISIPRFAALQEIDTSAWRLPLLATQIEGRSGHRLREMFEYARRNNVKLHSRLLLALSHCLNMARVFACSEHIFYSHTPVTQPILSKYVTTTLMLPPPDTFIEFAIRANTAFAALFRPLIQFGIDLANSNQNLLHTTPPCFDALNTAQRFCDSEEFLMVTWKSDNRRQPLRGGERRIKDPTNQAIIRTYTGLSKAHIFGHEDNHGHKLVQDDYGREVQHVFLRLSLNRSTGKPDTNEGEFCSGSRALAIDTSGFYGLDLTPRPAAAAAARV